MRLFGQLKAHENLSPGKDIAAGIIVALVSIPISMGYAGIAGLPVVYGLYGSLLPILVFAFLTTSKQFVVGVDAMPAAMAGALLSTLGITAESEEAMELVPVLAFLTAAWFLLFYLVKAGRVVKYISAPVMGGFISGVGLTIILMQVPKLFGGNAGTGEVLSLIRNILEQAGAFHGLSAALGFGTVVIILLCKKWIPKVPMTVIMMGVGAVLEAVFKLSSYGVKTLPEVASGLPHLSLPDFRILGDCFPDAVLETFSIALVIMAQTLLASGSYAAKYDNKLDNNAELLAYAGMNLAGGLVGCCPVNGSVSRSALADSFGCRSQLMSVSAAFTMGIVLLFGTPLLKYLPVPVLTGIVMTALIGIIDGKLAKRLFKTSRNEFFIFLAAMFGVLFFGTVNGVLLGCALSFADFALQCARPESGFVGRIPGQGNFHMIDRYRSARPIVGTVIYRFNGNLFFANIDRFEEEILEAVKEDTRQVVVDARSVGNIDVTAIDRIRTLRRKLEARGVRFFLAEHDGRLNDQLFLLGAGDLITEGAVRRTITLALEACGVCKPYTLEGGEEEAPLPEMQTETDVTEFEWAFGDHAEEMMTSMAKGILEKLEHGETELPVLSASAADTPTEAAWSELGPAEEEELWDIAELILERRAGASGMKQEKLKALESRLEERRISSMKRFAELSEEQRKRQEKRLLRFEKRMEKRYPEEFKAIRNNRDKNGQGEK